MPGIRDPGQVPRGVGNLPSSDQCTPSQVSQTPGRPSCGPHLRTECGLREGSLHTHTCFYSKADATLGRGEKVWVSLCL